MERTPQLLTKHLIQDSFYHLSLCPSTICLDGLGLVYGV